MAIILLQNYPNLINQCGPDKATPLHYAAGSGDTSIVNFLLQRGAKIFYDNKNESPLHWACLNGHLKAAQLLLQAGANPNDKSLDGKTGLHYAVMNKHADLVAFLLADKRIDNTIQKDVQQIAIQKGDKNIAQLFDPEKRKIISVVSDLKKTIEELKQTLSQKEKQREVDQKNIENIYRELAQEEENHRKN